MTHSEIISLYEKSSFLSDGSSWQSDWQLIDEERKKYFTPYASVLGNCEVSIGPGWWPAFGKLCFIIESLNSPTKVFKFAQVKEKFGGLRAYLLPVLEEIPDSLWESSREAVRQCEDFCDVHCEICGEPGELGGEHWVKCYCPKHRAMENSRNK